MDAVWDANRSIRVLVESDSTESSVDAEYKELFEAYDRDRSGAINFKELAAIASDAGTCMMQLLRKSFECHPPCAAAGIESRAQKYLFEEADKNGDGSLDCQVNRTILIPPSCIVISCGSL